MYTYRIDWTERKRAGAKKCVEKSDACRTKEDAIAYAVALVSETSVCCSGVRVTDERTGEVLFDSETN